MNASATSIRYSRYSTDVPYQADLSIHSRETELHCRPSQQTIHSSVRTTNFEEFLQSDSKAMDRYKVRCIRGTSEQCPTNVLEPLSGSRSDSGGCVQTTVAVDGVVFEPTLETHTKSAEKIERRQSGISSVSDTFMEHIVLVANDSPSPTGQASSLQEQQYDFDTSDRMEVIRYYRQKQGLSEVVTQILQQKNRKTSAQAYNEYWRNWVRWCRMQRANPLSEDTRLLSNHLLFFQVYNIYSRKK
ncbi:hypothetical protein RMATCC62417_17724 [Rhizopus microsporus]|nr:hypothetical protein RMATCC62417_17724 [Rhizopus microsporus]